MGTDVNHVKIANRKQNMVRHKQAHNSVLVPIYTSMALTTLAHQWHGLGSCLTTFLAATRSWHIPFLNGEFEPSTIVGQIGVAYLSWYAQGMKLTPHAMTAAKIDSFSRLSLTKFHHLSTERFHQCYPQHEPSHIFPMSYNTCQPLPVAGLGCWLTIHVTG